MKYMVLLCDGMADRPLKELGGATPMQKAYKPNMDCLAKTAEIGLVKTVADGLKPGSDVANLSVIGYDPVICYTGRSPLEAASIGVDLKPTDVALRCNLVTLSDDADYNKKTMVDYCAGDISTAEAKVLIEAVEREFGNEKYKFYAGVSYRHCLVVDNGTTELGDMTPPHDISDRVIGQYLSNHENSAELINLMKRSYDFLMEQPINKERIAKGLRPANSVWLWGEGKKPMLEKFVDKYGKTCGIVSAVDLIKGIGICAGMKIIDVEGATGYIDTNFEGKMQAAAEHYKNGCDVVYVHIEAPDECGHRGEIDNKVKSIELIDQKILGPMLRVLETYGDYRILIMPDHPTPIAIKTHCSDPVPYLLFDNAHKKNGVDCFCEKTAEQTGIYVDFGPSMMGKLLDL
ncbi:MAG: cofactor-independent phosphoglycerate mutase [Oscillospiraceae bacterium]|nr:cofactor-independent phosphoglycerate mutase [Oscillospiraceae bacterium]